MYRVKKYQYLLYKHALLHGLNASLAVNTTTQTLNPDFWTLGPGPWTLSPNP